MYKSCLVHSWTYFCPFVCIGIFHFDEVVPVMCLSIDRRCIALRFSTTTCPTNINYSTEMTICRLVLSGHTHHSCRTNHTGGLPEWTVSSFSWRNKKNPSFLLAKFSRSSVSIEKCYMPDENTLYVIYVLFVGVLIVAMFKEEGTVLYKASRLILKKRNVN